MIDSPVVLYVEDDPLSREIMKIILEYVLNCSSYFIFEDSTDFAARLERLMAKPDVIFLDIHMEPLDGLSMLQIIRKMENFHDVPVIGLTASVMNEEVQLLRQVGFNGAIAKPLNQDTFPDALARILNNEQVWRIS